MKVAACILSWVGAALTTFVELFSLFSGATIMYQKLDPYTLKYVTVSEHIDFPIWAWVVWFVLLAARLAVLFYREVSIYYCRKVKCGVLTIIFASILGGIFTLCIPEYSLYKVSRRAYYKKMDAIRESSKNDKPVSQNETEKALEELDILEAYKSSREDLKEVKERYKNK